MFVMYCLTMYNCITVPTRRFRASAARDANCAGGLSLVHITNNNTDNHNDNKTDGHNNCYYWHYICI